MATAVSIPDKVFRRAEKAAKKKKISCERLIAKAVESYLDEYEDEEIIAKINDFYEKNPATIAPTITKMAALSLLKEEW